MRFFPNVWFLIHVMRMSRCRSSDGAGAFSNGLSSHIQLQETSYSYPHKLLSQIIPHFLCVCVQAFPETPLSCFGSILLWGNCIVPRKLDSPSQICWHKSTVIPLTPNGVTHTDVRTEENTDYDASLRCSIFPLRLLIFVELTASLSLSFSGVEATSCATLCAGL